MQYSHNFKKQTCPSIKALEFLYLVPEWVWKALHQIRKASQAAEVADTSNEDDEEEDSASYAQQFRIEMVAKQGKLC